MNCKKGIMVAGDRVPCGQCMPCRINKGRLWSARILLEQAFSEKSSWFLTFTYKDEQLPVTNEYVPTLRKSEFQNFIQNSQRDIGTFRYYLVGEYGDNTLRPHYHLALFPTNDYQVTHLTTRWEKGFTSAYELIPERARYLANYTAKKLTKHTDDRLSPGQEPEFRSSSRTPGLGYAAVGAIAERYKTQQGKKILEERGDIERTVRFDGTVYPLDRYILNKVRERLDIPLLHRERLNHPGYYAHNQTQEAEFDLHSAFAQEEKIASQKKFRQLRKTTIEI